MGGIMKLAKIIRFASVALALSSTVFTATAASTSDVVSKRDISAKLQSLVPFVVIDVTEHETGLYEIVADKGVFYATKDGKHLFSGAVHQFQEGLPNLTEMKKQEVAKTMIDTLRPTFLTYKAPQQKHEIIAFFDSSCGYCRKMHSEMSRYNAMGITVHYALFPRNGLQSQSVTDLSSVACSANSQVAMNTLMQGGAIQPATCDSPVSKHYDLGQWLGVSGTPMIFNMGGEIVMEGYAPANTMLTALSTGNYNQR